MKCPACNDVDLVKATRSGIQIDACPKCRGVWLDRGELERLLQKAVVESVPVGPSRLEPTIHVPQPAAPPAQPDRPAGPGDPRTEPTRG